MLKKVTKEIDNKIYTLKIDQDDFCESPREWAEESFLCIREHRRYKFPNELDFNFEYEIGDFDDLGDSQDFKTPEALAKEKGLKLFMLDCYEHGTIHFSISGTGMQCGFDTSSNCGFILAKDLKQAEAEIELYNAYLNGWIYQFIITFVEKIKQDGKDYFSEEEHLESCGGFYELEDMHGHQDIFDKEDFIL